MSPAYAADHTVFAGLRGHGVYRSVDGGNAWQPLGLLDQVIIDLAISPNFAADHTLFAAAGLGSGGYKFIGRRMAARRGSRPTSPPTTTASNH